MSADKGGGSGSAISVLDAEFKACQEKCERMREKHCPTMVELKIKEAVEEAFEKFERKHMQTLTAFGTLLTIIISLVNIFIKFHFGG